MVKVSSPDVQQEEGPVSAESPAPSARQLIPPLALLLVLALLLLWGAGFFDRLALAGWGGLFESEPSRARRDVQIGEGRRLYLQNCASCHGLQGNRIPAAALDSPTFVDGLGVRLIDSIADGKGAMPAWARERGGSLAAGQVKAIAEYLRAGDRPGILSVDQGRQLYTTHCSSCHGEQGDRLPEYPLRSREYLSALGQAGLNDVIAGGKGTMLAFGQERNGPLRYAEVQAISFYLVNTAAATKPAAAPTVPTAPEGKALYERHCTKCHGARGNLLATNLSSLAFLAAKDDGALQRAIASGQVGMPAFGADRGGPLSAEAIGALVVHLRSGAGKQ